MKKWIIITLALAFLPFVIRNIRNNKTDISDSPLTVTSGELKHIDLYSPEMNETIKVDVWTPDGYSRKKKYPVVYMHDGQNLFDANSTWNHQAWEIDSVLGKLIAENSIKPAIIVGVYSTDSTRLGDLMPEKPLQYLENDTIKNFIAKMCRDNYRADEYLAFIVNTLRPIRNKKLATDTTLMSTSIMGSSMGGLISIYGLCEYPHVFGTAACLSTHWTGALGGNEDFPGAMRRYLIKNLGRSTTHKIYIDNGTCPYDSVYTPYMHQMVALITRLGYKGDQVKWDIYPGHGHNEQSWARRVEVPLKYILGNQ